MDRNSDYTRSDYRTLIADSYIEISNLREEIERLKQDMENIRTSALEVNHSMKIFLGQVQAVKNGVASEIEKTTSNVFMKHLKQVEDLLKSLQKAGIVPVENISSQSKNKRISKKVEPKKKKFLGFSF